MCVNRIEKYFEMAPTETTNEKFAKAVNTLLTTIDGTDTSKAATIGVAQATIGNYRLGVLPGSDTKPFLRFCRHFHVSPSALRKGRVVYTSTIPKSDIHAMVDQVLAGPSGDALRTTIEAFWRSNVARTDG